ncbi:MAG: DUF4194 domain-containing protein [Oribacterium sp.]|nr:DUF4194 domain-containing protein [Oribacterium sp.]
MEMHEYWDEFTGGEKDQFQRAARRLLRTTFIVRDKDEDSKKLYYFVSNQREALSLYLGYIGFDLIVDRENGVIMLRNLDEGGEFGRVGSNRLMLKKVDSLLLCAIWTIYDDKIHSGTMSRKIFISVMDLNFTLEKFGVKDIIDKTTMSDSLKLFKKYNLLDVVGKVGDPDCRIALFPSLLYCMNDDEFETFLKNATDRMLQRKSGFNADDDEDDIDDMA